MPFIDLPEVFGQKTDARSTSTDTTATSAMNVLKQISFSDQAIATSLGTTLRAFSSRVSVTRPSDTTTYAAGDVVGVTGGGTASISFTNMASAAGPIMITSTRFQRNATAVISGESTYTLHLFNVTQPAAQADNAVFDVAAGDQASYLGKINLGAPIDLGSTLHVEQNNIMKQVTLLSTTLFGVLVTDTGYQPASAAVHVIELNGYAL